MISDLKLATVRLDKRGSASPMADAGVTPSFDDALDARTPRRNGAAVEARRMPTSARDRLAAALNESLDRNAEILAGAGEDVDPAIVGDSWLQPDAEVETETEAETEAGEELETDQPEKRVFVALPGYLNTRERPSSPHAAHRLLEARTLGQPAAFAQQNDAGSTAGSMPGVMAKGTAAAETIEAPAKPSPDRADERMSLDRTPAEQLKDGAADRVADAARPQSMAASNTNGQLAAQIQVVTADPASTPAQAMVDTIGAEPSWAAYFRDKGLSASQPIKALKIQLHPAELGAVTALMRTSGDAVEVEITAETAEARKHLAAEADEILRSLRQVGVDVDRITVHLADNGANATGKNASNQEWRNFSSFHGQEQRDGGSSQHGRGGGSTSGDGGAGYPDRESQANRSAGRYI